MNIQTAYIVYKLINFDFINTDVGWLFSQNIVQCVDECTHSKNITARGIHKHKSQLQKPEPDDSKSMSKEIEVYMQILRT